MSETVVIKKYENRRLYDTRSSSYINLEGVAGLIHQGLVVEVVDAKSGEDITRQVLTQIIVERAKDPNGGPPLDFLRNLVRASDQAQRDFFHWYLSAAGEVYERLQEAWQRSARSAVAPWQSWMKLWDPNRAASSLLKLWTDPFAHEQRSAPEPPAPPPAPPSSVAEGGEDNPQSEIAELRSRLEELERRLMDEQG